EYAQRLTYEGQNEFELRLLPFFSAEATAPLAWMLGVVASRLCDASRSVILDGLHYVSDCSPMRRHKFFASGTYNFGRLVQLARTPARHAGGQRFESSIAQSSLSNELTSRRQEFSAPAEGRQSGLIRVTKGVVLPSWEAATMRKRAYKVPRHALRKPNG